MYGHYDELSYIEPLNFAINGVQYSTGDFFNIEKLKNKLIERTFKYLKRTAGVEYLD